MGKPTKRQKMEAYQAFFYAVTLEQKQAVLKQHKDVLLRKYGFFDDSIPDISIEMMQRQGSDVDGLLRHSTHTDLIDEARKKGIDQAIREAKQNANKLQYLSGAPDEKGTVLTQVIYMEDKNRPHPFMSDGDAVELVAYPSFMEVRKSRGQEELASIPWNNITNIYTSYKGKGGLLTFGADLANMVWPSAGYSHDGVVIVYNDTLFNSELMVFFRVRGEKNAQKLTKQLMQRIYDYRRRTGEGGGPQ